MSSWFLYIIETDVKKLYTGITTDVARRFEEHRFSKKGAKFFNTCNPLRVVHIETFETRSEASKREFLVKKMTRAAKLKLIKDNSTALCNELKVS